MSYYIQLSQEERYHISVLCKEGFSKTETAKKINRHISTISRELNRNTDKKVWKDFNYISAYAVSHKGLGIEP